MELRHLRYFIAVAEAGSLTAAAERRLHTSQPSLSRQIRALEDEVGTPLLSRSVAGVGLTDAGRAFIDHARLALLQVDAAIESARRAALPTRPRFAIGFLTGQEMIWLPGTMRELRHDLPNIEVAVSSDYSPDLAAAVASGRIDVAFLRAEPGYDLVYRVIRKEPLVVLMPAGHRLAARRTVRPKDLASVPFIEMGTKAGLLRNVVDRYLTAGGVTVRPSQRVDNPAMVMSLVASTGGITIIPAYVVNLMPSSVVARPLAGTAPTIELVVGFSRSNASPVLERFLSRLDAMVADVEEAARD